MSWLEVVNEGLPPPRDDEPVNLRRDIVDELTDHLTCAMEREIRRREDPAAAQRAVLERFGDPRRLAYRLWAEAMKEKIMKDRIMLGAVVLLVAASIATAAVAWLTFQKGQEVNQAILARLEALATPTQAPGPEVLSNWSKLTFQLIGNDEQKKPAEGIYIDLNGKPFNDSDKQTLHERTNAEGLATFGPIRPGHYEYIIGRAYNRYLIFRLNEVFDLYAGSEQKKVIVYPTSATEASVAFSVNWPEDLANKEFLVQCYFTPKSMQIGNGQWSSSRYELCIVDDGMIIQGYVISSGTYVSERYTPYQPPSYRGFLPSHCLYEGIKDKLSMNRQVLQPAVGYLLQSIRLFVPVNDPRFSPTKAWHDFASYDYPKDQWPMYEARAGGLNQWKIELPEQLLTDFREHLTAFAEATTRPD